MSEDDFNEFRELLDSVCSLLSRGNYQATAENTALWFRSLADHSIDAVRAGFTAHVKDPQRGRFVPTPADILSQIAGMSENDGRPGTEEAWAMALRSRDEADTIVWTIEMAEAWGIANNVMRLGDEVGARMAFKEVYTRLVADARRAHKPISWSASLGHDPQLRERAISAAVMAGRLPHSEFKALPKPSNVSLLSLAETTACSEQTRQTLRELADRLRARANEPSAQQLEHERTQALKAEAARKAGEYAQQIGKESA